MGNGNNNTSAKGNGNNPALTGKGKDLNAAAQAHNAQYGRNKAKHTPQPTNKSTVKPANKATNKQPRTKPYVIAGAKNTAKSHVDFRKLLLSGNNVDYMFYDDDDSLDLEMNDTVILVASNGIFEIIKTPIGIFNIKLGTVEIPLPELKKFNPMFLWSIPKPNISLLYDLFALNKAVFNKYSSEVFAPIVFNTVTKQYEIVVPKQVVSGAHVTYDKVTYPANTMQVIDHHSHAGMGAFFSGTDDADDKQVRFKISIVIGKNNTNAPEVKARLTINGNFVEVEVSSLFATSNNNINKLLKNVTKDKIQYGHGYGGYGHGATAYDPTGKNKNVHQPAKNVHQPAKNIAALMPDNDMLPLFDDEFDEFMLDDDLHDTPPAGKSTHNVDDENHMDHLLDLQLDQWGIFEAATDYEIKAIIAKYKKETGLADDAIDTFVIAASEFLG